MGSLKAKVDAMRTVVGKKACHHGYNIDNVIRTLYAYIDDLESGAAPIKVKVGMMEATVSPGKDGKLGTKDDSVKLSLAKKKKKAPTKKRTAKKK